MSRRVRWMAAILAVALAVVVGLRVGDFRSGLPRVTLPDGKLLEVVQIDLGTNSLCSTQTGWKRIARRLTPYTWEALFLGQEPMSRRRAPFPSMMIWVRVLDENGHPVPGWRLPAMQVNSRAKAEVVPSPSTDPDGFACLLLRDYPRDKTRFAIEIGRPPDLAQFEVENPDPVRPARWTTRGLPQTNWFPNSGIALSGRPSGTAFRPRAGVRSPANHPVGWPRWTVYAFDVLGNWTVNSYSSSSSSSAAEFRLTSAASKWRIITEGEEYLSAGFVPGLEHGAAIGMSPVPRAGEYGVRYVLAVGGGAFRVENGEVRFEQDISVGALTRSEVAARVESAGTNWSIELKATGPGVLLISESGRPEPPPRARIRERDSRNQGRVFAGNVASTRLVVGSEAWDVQFFAARLMGSTNRLEVEVIGTLPAAEFFVELPASSSTE